VGDNLIRLIRRQQIRFSNGKPVTIYQGELKNDVFKLSE